jgi:hypothetical protein
LDGFAALATTNALTENRTIEGESPLPVFKTAKTWMGVASIVAATRLADVALAGVGLATATGSVVFAGAMLMRDDHAPGVNGLEYLAIFARPRGGAKTAEPPVATIDTTPVGSIGRAGPPEMDGYAIVAARADFAWVREGARIFAVRPGDVLPRLGRVSAVMRREGRWTIVGDAGTALVSGTAAAPEPGGPFARRLIFGADK